MSGTNTSMNTGNRGPATIDVTPNIFARAIVKNKQGSARRGLLVKTLNKQMRLSMMGALGQLEAQLR